MCKGYTVLEAMAGVLETITTDELSNPIEDVAFELRHCYIDVIVMLSNRASSMSRRFRPGA